MREDGLTVREGFPTGNTPGLGLGLYQVGQLELLQIVSEMFAVVEAEGEGAAEGLETDGAAVSSLLLLHLSLLPRLIWISRDWLRLLSRSGGSRLILNIEVCDPQQVGQIANVGGQAGVVLLRLPVDEELQEDGESVDVGVGEDDGAAHTGTIIQKIGESWTE